MRVIVVGDVTGYAIARGRQNHRNTSAFYFGAAAGSPALPFPANLEFRLLCGRRLHYHPARVCSGRLQLALWTSRCRAVAPVAVSLLTRAFC